MKSFLQIKFARLTSIQKSSKSFDLMKFKKLNLRIELNLKAFRLLIKIRPQLICRDRIGKFINIRLSNETKE